MTEKQILMLQHRADGIAAWLDENCPYVYTDQRHLDANTTERCYWHHGYRAALEDVIHFARHSGKLGSK